MAVSWMQSCACRGAFVCVGIPVCLSAFLPFCLSACCVAVCASVCVPICVPMHLCPVCAFPTGPCAPIQHCTPLQAVISLIDVSPQPAIDLPSSCPTLACLALPCPGCLGSRASFHLCRYGTTRAGALSNTCKHASARSIAHASWGDLP